MRKLLLGSVAMLAFLAGPVSAADVPISAPVYRASPVIYDWTGFYVGGHVGYAWSNKKWDLPARDTIVNYTGDGIIGGVQGGYNWQIGAWVLGVEAQASWGKMRRDASLDGLDPTPWVQPDPNPITGQRTVTNARLGTTVENLGTIAARAGYAFDRSLVFVKLGAAWAHDVYGAFDAGRPGEPLIATGSDTRWGWMFGIGYEYAFLGNWSVKVEYDYLGFVSKHITLTSVAAATPRTRDFEIWQDISLIKLGINYRFGPTAIFARY
jgi:outer membrane immunogenic protein